MARAGAVARRRGTVRPLESVEGRRPQPARLDRVIHERMRLGIVSALAVNDTLTFKIAESLYGTSA